MGDTMLSDIGGVAQRALLSPVQRVFEFGAQSHWLTYAAAAFLAACFYVVSRRKRKTSLRGLMSYLLPKKFIRHASTRLDVQLFVLGSIYLSLQGLFLFGALKVSDGIVAGLTNLFGPGAQDASPSLFIALLTPVLLLLALEFGYWFAHYLMHRYAWLWEFHKVHHSAEIMTPLTEWRQHPFELLFFPIVMNLCIGVTLGALTYAFSSGPSVMPFWTMTTILMVFFFTILHLRHSHVKLFVPRWLGCIVQSPAHHQIHHSTEPRHYNKNLGYCLSVWDFAFGTLFHPRKDETLTFGIDDDHHGHYQTLTGSLAEPFRSLYRRMRKASR